MQDGVGEYFFLQNLRQYAFCKKYREEGKFTYNVTYVLGESTGNSSRCDDVTLLTQLNVERIYMLRDLVLAWPGSLADRQHVQADKIT